MSPVPDAISASTWWVVWMGYDRDYDIPGDFDPLDFTWDTDCGRPETDDGIVFHPTYEGKIIRYLNGMEPEWWTRDDKTMLWVVGGPLP